MVVYIDFEYRAPKGERPEPHCVVWATSDGEMGELWLGDNPPAEPPYPTGDGVTLCCYTAWAEMTCHLVLGWNTDSQVLDLYAEYRNETNGSEHDVRSKRGLIHALKYYGLDAMAGVEKQAMRELAMRGGPYTDKEKRDLLDYCAEDVRALIPLHAAMTMPEEIREALLRGRFQIAAANMMHNGMPIDLTVYEALLEHREELQEFFIRKFDPDFELYIGTSWVNAKFEDWLIRHDIPWIYKEGKRGEILDLREEAFRAMGLISPRVEKVRTLRDTVKNLRSFNYPVGSDGRHRTIGLGAFGTITGRNASSQFIMLATAWLRGLVKPAPGMALAYIDWTAQEIAVSAQLSGDPVLLETYESDDIYLDFAKRAGAAPEDATKETHPEVRALYKAVVLGVSYGMGYKAMAQNSGIPEAKARQLIGQFHRIYKRYHRWTKDVITAATLDNKQVTRYGWQRQLTEDYRPTALQNWPVQSTAAEMMRMAAIFTVEAGVTLVGTVHDALLIEAPIEKFERAIKTTRAAMNRASKYTIDYVVKTEVDRIRYPNRFEDKRGKEMWVLAIEALEKGEV